MAQSKMEKLTESLDRAFSDVLRDRRMVPQAKEASNIAGKIINIQKLELDYRRAQRKDPTLKLDYLEKAVD